MKTALISVYDKTGITDFAKSLVDLGWKIISSGGTAKHLLEAGIQVTDVADITGMPAILSHRVVTLHPKIHGGLLALPIEEHLAEMKKEGIPWISLVCSDLYPLEEEIKKTGSTKESVIAQTDMGGIALIRSAAKGRRIVICDPADRIKVIEWLKDGENDREEFLNNLAAKAEATASRYCGTSAEYHSLGTYKNIFGKKMMTLAYGENAYQNPSFLFRAHGGGADQLSIVNWQLVAGSPLSYNNICDVDRMMQTMTHIGAGFEKNFGKIPYIAIGAKHGNACGAGISQERFLREFPQEPLLEAIRKMLLGDLRAIFGGSVMLNFNVDEKIAEELIHKYAGENRRLLDIVAAPSFSAEAIEILSRKKGKCRLLANPAILKAGLSSLDDSKRFRYVRGGFMEQPNYTFVPKIDPLLISPLAGGEDANDVLADVILAWAVGCTSNSNTITLTKDGQLLGNGVGQQDRVGAAKLAIFRADEASEFKAQQEKNVVPKADLNGAVAYSDSFFPFPDAPEVLINRGIKTIFATSGSVNDDKIIELCKQKGVNLIMLPDAEARGFYQH